MRSSRRCSSFSAPHFDRSTVGLRLVRRWGGWISTYLSIGSGQPDYLHSALDHLAVPMDGSAVDIQEPVMSIEVWAAFVAASAILLIIPGPTVLLVVSYALGQGWRAALPMAVGVALGDFTAMTLSMLGVGALLAASAGLFTALRWLGAAYLIWLGIKLWRAGGTF